MPGCCRSRRTRHGKKRTENKIKAVKPFLLSSFQCHFIRSKGRGGGGGRGPGILATKILWMQTPLKCTTASKSSQRVSSLLLLLLGRAGCAHNSTMTLFSSLTKMESYCFHVCNILIYKYAYKMLGNKKKTPIAWM